MKGFHERCHFFNGVEEDQFIYGCTYIPTAKKSTGVVLVSPIGRERLRCYHESANLARDLASRGYPVLRFDYRGEGESSGEFAEATVTSRLEDIAAMVQELRSRAEVEEICLVGFRLGAYFATRAAVDLGIQHMILCDPVCNPAKFAKSMIRSNIVLQSQYFGKVGKKEPALRKDLQQGETISVFGFHLGLPFLEELEQADPEAGLIRFVGKAAIIYLSTRKTKPKKGVARWCELLSRSGHCEAICVEINFSWASRKMWQPRLEPLNELVSTWLEENA